MYEAARQPPSARRLSLKPESPVHAFAWPELIITALTLPFVSNKRCLHNKKKTV